MENKELAEIKNNLAMLPGLNDRLKRLNQRLFEAEKDVNKLLSEFNEESYDVEKLRKESLSVTLLKLIGKYEDKLDKETQEAVAAKMNYDKVVDLVNELESERNDISDRIARLEKDRELYKEELESREKLLMGSIGDEASLRYKELEAEREELVKEQVEINEARRAAMRVTDTANGAIEELDSAEDWATYDVWTKGGLFSHMAKYDHIDDAQAMFNALESQLNILQKELQDVDMFEHLEISGVYNSSRLTDFLFDNIFTDMSVRNDIRDNIGRVDSLCSQIRGIIKRLEDKDYQIGRKLDDIENKKEDLLISNS